MIGVNSTDPLSNDCARKIVWFRGSGVAQGATSSVLFAQASLLDLLLHLLDSQGQKAGPGGSFQVDGLMYTALPEMEGKIQ